MAWIPDTTWAHCGMLFLGAALLLDCSRSADTCQGAATPASESLGVYWLESAQIYDFPEGGMALDVRGPVLTELFMDRRVRSVFGASESLKGYLPRCYFERPQNGGGPMLYAQQTTDLYDTDIGGVSLGRLHRGALVSVAPGRTRHRTPVGTYHFGEPRLGYVDRDALGYEPQFLEPVKKGQATFSKIGYHALEAQAVLAFCSDVWIRKQGESWVAAQYIDGVERILEARNRPNVWATRPTWYAVLESCPAHAVVADGGILTLIVPPQIYAGHATRVEISAVPEGYERMAIPNDESVRDTVSRGGVFYWLDFTEEGPKCDEWRVSPLGRRGHGLSASYLAKLTRTDQLQTESGMVTASYETVYRPSDGDSAAHLKMAPLQYNGKPANKCDCLYDYSLLRVRGDELTLMGRTLPAGTLSYDASEAERWYLSKRACETALTAIEERLAVDGTIATKVGFHAYENQ